MATCQFCMPWNAPLTQQSKLSAFGAVVPMTFEASLWFHLHVAMHQHQNWNGEIEQYTRGEFTLASTQLRT